MNRKAKTVQNIKSAKTIRNVLVQPFKTVWPCVASEDATKLVKMLNELPSAHVVHGTNPVSHLLSQGQACALFITSDFHPQILGKQIIQMARRNCPQIPILAPECLKWGEKLEKLIALRTTSNEQPEATELLKYMTDVIKAKEYDKDRFVSKPSEKKLQQEPKTEERAPDAVLPRPHLNRPVENKRAFIPQVSMFATKQLTCSSKEDWGEYITFKRKRSETEKTDEPKSKKISKQKPTKPERKSSTSYIPLTVNRIQGNPNRKADKRKQK